MPPGQQPIVSAETNTPTLNTIVKELYPQLHFNTRDSVKFDVIQQILGWATTDCCSGTATSLQVLGQGIAVVELALPPALSNRGVLSARDVILYFEVFHSNHRVFRLTDPRIIEKLLDGINCKGARTQEPCLLWAGAGRGRVRAGGLVGDVVRLRQSAGSPHPT